MGVLAPHHPQLSGAGEWSQQRRLSVRTSPWLPRSKGFTPFAEVGGALYPGSVFPDPSFLGSVYFESLKDRKYSSL